MEHPVLILAVAGAMSLAAHGFAYASLGLAPSPPHEPPPTRVSFRVHDAPPPPPPAPLPPKPPEPRPPEPRSAKAKPKSAPSVNPEPVVPAPPVVDLRGVTLTNDTGSGWSSAVGNGSGFEGPLGPIGKPGARAASAPAALPVATRAVEPPVLAVADLSARPVPPELTTNLREHYPADARQRGIGGSASVEVRIEPDGRVRVASVQSESFSGFGEACRKTLLGSQWSAPRDKQGHAVATRVHYTCRFVVEH